MHFVQGYLKANRLFDLSIELQSAAESAQSGSRGDLVILDFDEFPIQIIN